MRLALRSAVIAASVGAIVAAHFGGRSIGYNTGFRQGRTQELVKLAGYLTEELNSLHRERVPNTKAVTRHEQLLQSTLIGLMWNTSPAQLASDEHLMEAMHYVRSYRQMFPYDQEAGLNETNSLDSFWPATAHEQMQAFLDALPKTDAAAQRRIESHFSK